MPHKSPLLFFFALLLAACAIQPPVPAGYTGPVARIQDSVAGGGLVHANFFYLAEINGQPVAHSGTEVTGIKPMIPEWPLGAWTVDMTVDVTGRPVPAERATFRIVGRTRYTILFRQMFYPSNEVSGEITFTPKADEIYSVRGEITETYSAVWIADGAGTPVAPKIEVRRPAAQRVLEPRNPAAE